MIIFDVDDTLRYCTVAGQPCPNKPGEWKLLENVKEKLAEFNWGSPQEGKIGYGLASNQGGVGVGYFSAEMAFQLLIDTFEAAFGFAPVEDVIQMCTPKPDDFPECRKPKAGMLKKIWEFWQVKPSETLFIGDRESDRLTAVNGGCDFLWAQDFFTSGSSEKISSRRSQH